MTQRSLTAEEVPMPGRIARLSRLAVLGLLLAGCGREATTGGAGRTATPACSAAAPGASPTATVAPPSPVLSDEAVVARGVTTRFVMDVLNGRDAAARAALAPDYSARVPDLREALGVQPGRAVAWTVGATTTTADRAGSTVEVPMRYSGGADCANHLVRLLVTLTRVGESADRDGWRIVAIEPVR